MDTPDQSFGKKHKLCNKALIDKLFAEGQSLFAYPLKCVFMVDDKREQDKEPVQIMVSVSKRYHKHAVARNLLKRRIRESYRLNRHLWETEQLLPGKKLSLALLYTSKEIIDYTAIENGVVKAIRSVKKNLAKDSDLSAGSVD